MKWRPFPKGAGVSMTEAGSSAGGKQMDTRHLCFPDMWPHRWQMGQSHLPILRSPSEAVGNSWQRTDSTPGWSRWDLSEWACGCKTPVSASVQLVWGSPKCLELETTGKLNSFLTGIDAKLITSKGKNQHTELSWEKKWKLTSFTKEAGPLVL